MFYNPPFLKRKLLEAGKTGEPDLSVYSGEDWPRFVQQYANSWLRFHTEWFTSFEGPITVSCFTDLVSDPVNEVSRWLQAMDFDDRRVGCIEHDPVGQERVFKLIMNLNLLKKF